MDALGILKGHHAFGELAKAKPPAGYQPIPSTRHSGYRKRQGNKWVYWYPDKQSAHAASEAHGQHAEKMKQRAAGAKSPKDKANLTRQSQEHAEHAKGAAEHAKGVKEKVEGAATAAKEKVKGLSADGQRFMEDEAYRKEVLGKAADHLRSSPGKLLERAVHALKEEGDEFASAGRALLGLARGKPMDAHHKKALITASVTVAASVLGAAGIDYILGKLGKNIAIHVAANAMHRSLGQLWMVNEGGHVAHHVFEGVMHLMKAEDVEPAEVGDTIAGVQEDPEKAIRMFLMLAISEMAKQLEEGDIGDFDPEAEPPYGLGVEDEDASDKPGKESLTVGSADEPAPSADEAPADKPAEEPPAKAEEGAKKVTLTAKSLRKLRAMQTTKSLRPLLKARGYPVGTVRDWKGGRYRKTAGGKWVPQAAGGREQPEQEKPEATSRERDLDPSDADEFFDVPGQNLRVIGKGSKGVVDALAESLKESDDLCAARPGVCKGNMGISRSVMPQLSKKPMRDFLVAVAKQGTKVRRRSKTVGDLRASQREILSSKVLGMSQSVREGSFGGITSPIIVSSDGYVVDGHHRWATLMTLDHQNKMEVYEVDMPIDKLLVAAASAPGAEFRALHDDDTAKDGDPVGRLRQAIAQSRGEKAQKSLRRSGGVDYVCASGTCVKADDPVGRKIVKLIEEGKPRDQAVAIALEMERRGTLEKSDGRWAVLAQLLVKAKAPVAQRRIGSCAFKPASYVDPLPVSSNPGAHAAARPEEYVTVADGPTLVGRLDPVLPGLKRWARTNG